MPTLKRRDFIPFIITTGIIEPSIGKGIPDSILKINVPKYLDALNIHPINNKYENELLTEIIQSLIEKFTILDFDDNIPFEYSLGQLVLQDNTSLVGNSILKKLPNINTSIIQANNKNNISIFINIDCNSQEQKIDHADIWLENCLNVVLDSCCIKNGFGSIKSTYGSVTLKKCNGAFIGDGLRIENSKYDGLYLIDGADQVVRGGIYSSCGYSGIATVGSARVTLTQVVAINNGTSNITLNGPMNFAINCTGTGSKKNHGINIGHNKISNRADFTKVIGGYFANNAMFGVCILGGNIYSQKNIELTDLVSCYNKIDGIKLISTDSCFIKNVYSHSNYADGIRIDGVRISVIDSIISNNGRHGLNFDAFTKIHNIENNNIFGNLISDINYIKK